MTRPAPSVYCRMKRNNIVLATTRALRSLVWVTEVYLRQHTATSNTPAYTPATATSEHIHTLKQCHIYTWIHSHCTYKCDVPSTHTNALHLHTNTHIHTPHAPEFSYLAVYIQFYVSAQSVHSAVSIHSNHHVTDFHQGFFIT